MHPDERPRRGHRHAARLADERPGRFPLRHRMEELAVFQHLRPDAAIDAAAEVLDELAVDVLRHRRARQPGIDRDGRRQRSRRQHLQRHVVEPRRAARAAPTAEEAVDLDGVVAVGVELERHPRPVVRARDSLGVGAAQPVEIHQRAHSRAGVDLVGLDPGAQAVARVGPDWRDSRPRGVAPGARRDPHAARSRLRHGRYPELGGSLKDGRLPARCRGSVAQLERRVRGRGGGRLRGRLGPASHAAERDREPDADGTEPGPRNGCHRRLPGGLGSPATRNPRLKPESWGEWVYRRPHRALLASKCQLPPRTIRVPPMSAPRGSVSCLGL